MDKIQENLAIALEMCRLVNALIEKEGFTLEKAEKAVFHKIKQRYPDFKFKRLRGVLNCYISNRAFWYGKAPFALTQMEYFTSETVREFYAVKPETVKKVVNAVISAPVEIANGTVRLTKRIVNGIAYEYREVWVSGHYRYHWKACCDVYISGHWRYCRRIKL